MEKFKAISYLKEVDEELKTLLASFEIEIVEEKDHDVAVPFLFLGESLKEVEDHIILSDREGETIIITSEMYTGDWSEVVDKKICLLHYDMVMSDSGQILLSRFLNNDTSIQLEKSFQTAITEMKTFKVSNPLYVGHYTDIAFNFAFEKKKNFLEVRKYLTNLLTFLTYLQQGEYIEVPFDVDIGMTAEGLVLQVHAPVKQLQFDILQKGFSQKFKHLPYGNLLLNCLESAGYFDIYTIKNSKKVIFTALWIDAVESRNFSYKVYDALEHKIYGAEIIASDIIMNYEFQSDTDGIYLPGRFMADKTRGRWFRIVQAQEIKKTLDQLKKDEQEIEEHKEFTAYLVENFDPTFSKEEITFMHRAHLSEELRTMFSESVFKSKMEVGNLEGEIQRIMESLLAVESVWPSKEVKEEVFSEAIMSGIKSKVALVFKKNDDQVKIKKLIMGIFVKEAKLDMRVANRLAEMFVSNGFDLFAVENFKLAFNEESGNTVMDSDEIVELKEKFAELEGQLDNVAEVNQEFEKESDNDELISRNKQLLKEVGELQSKLKKKHGGMFNRSGGGSLETNPSQLKAKIKNLEAQVRVANQKMDDMAKREKSQAAVGSGGAPSQSNSGGGAGDAKGSNKNSENLISRNILEVEKNKFNQEKKRLEAKLNTADMRFSTERSRLQSEIARMEKEVAKAKGKDKTLEIKRDLRKAQDEGKANAMKVKKLDMQNKALSKQLERLKKLKAASGPGAAGGKKGTSADPKKDMKIKQLETLYGKAQKQVDKFSKDLLERKSAMAKQKNEIQTLKNQIKQLQKKAA